VLSGLEKCQGIAGIEASKGFVAITSLPEEYTPLGLESDALIQKMWTQYGLGDIGYSMQPHILMMAIEMAQNYDPDEILKVLRTAEFHSYVKPPLKAGGEKTFGIKNHMSIPVYSSMVVGPNRLKYLRGYQMITP
jgi:hypothetical protein